MTFETLPLTCCSQQPTEQQGHRAESHGTVEAQEVARKFPKLVRAPRKKIGIQALGELEPCGLAVQLVPLSDEDSLSKAQEQIEICYGMSGAGG